MLSSAMAVELHHLRHFVAVAEDLNFSRAARRLCIAQPALSQSIKRLEVSLGLELFVRSRTNVELTPAGHAFFVETKATLLQVERAELAARRVASGEQGSLRLAYVTPAVFEVLPAIIRRFSRESPDVEVIFEELSVEDQIEKLRGGDIDLGIIMGRRELPPEIQLHFISRVDVAAAVPSKWPLARRQQIRLKDLRDQPLIMVPRERHPDIYDDFMAACRRLGFSPTVAHRTLNPMTTLSLVAGGMGIGLVAGASTSFWVRDVTIVPIVDPPGDPIARSMFVAWIPRVQKPALERLLSSVMALPPATRPQRHEA
jgi:DNA-binding transcriptional LysR family regulator